MPIPRLGAPPSSLALRGAARGRRGARRGRLRAVAAVPAARRRGAARAAPRRARRGRDGARARPPCGPRGTSSRAACGGLLGAEVPFVARRSSRDGVARGGDAEGPRPLVAALDLEADLARAGDEGFVIRSMRIGGPARARSIAANTDVGVLYGVFRLLRLLQTGQPVAGLAIVEAPRMRYRVLDHWDNLDRTVERGYAGFSLWDWHKLPDYLDPRYTRLRARQRLDRHQRHRAHQRQRERDAASRPEYLAKVAALADVFRPYGIRVYLTARFSAPDRDRRACRPPTRSTRAVAAWWRRKADEIYALDPRLRRLPGEGQLRGAARAAGLRAHPRRRRQRARRRARAARRRS